MKKLFFLTLIGALCALNILHAQKIKREVVGKYSYTQLPIDISLASSKTYKVVGHGDNVDSYEKDKMNSAIRLTGFEKKDRDAEDVDFIISVEKYAVKFTDSESKSYTKVTKKDNVEKKTKYYYYECEATYKYILKIKKDGGEIYKKESSGKETIEGKESTSSSTAYKNFKSKRNDYMQNVSSSKLKPISSTINEKYCTLIKSTSLRSAHLKPKKHKYDDYDSSFEDMKRGYLVLFSDENAIDEAKADLTKAIDGFTTLLKESDIENKKARINKKITALLYNNIGHCYFLMKDYVAASNSYSQAITIQKTFLDTKYLKQKSDNLNKRVEANKAL